MVAHRERGDLGWGFSAGEALMNKLASMSIAASAALVLRPLHCERDYGSNEPRNDDDEAKPFGPEWEVAFHEKKERSSGSHRKRKVGVQGVILGGLGIVLHGPDCRMGGQVSVGAF